MSSKISDAIDSAAAIAKGMGITFMEMLQPTITEDYPEAPAKFQERFRGVHELQRDENGLEKCVACFLCAAACPTDAITHGHGFEIASYNTSTLIYRKEQMLVNIPAGAHFPLKAEEPASNGGGH